MGILEQFWRPVSFRPRNLEELIGIELARRFNDLARVREYAALGSRTDLESLVGAFRASGGDPEAFKELVIAGASRASNPQHRAISICFERRRAGLAVIHAFKPKYAQVRELAGREEASTRSIEALVRWSVETYQPESAVLSMAAPEQASRAGRLKFVAKSLLLELGVPVENTSTKILLENYSQPPCRSVRESNSVVTDLFDLGELAPIAVQAVGVGIVFEVRRMFNDQSGEQALVA